ncbi:Adenine nucleotide transporter BT1 [Hibiscus syriacus]|uniref:Adenine nucleotide transporter BT1 n=1 Tax=Hibiscus syriacus TaxID=106335 RepID=A0A6A2X7A0_HIBSY|nr:Adenine nucleotide transporter BT1 [Hibiscus syriacus]
MSKRGVQMFDDKKDGFFSKCDLGSQWSLQQNDFHPGGLFASVGQMGIGFGPDSPNPRDDGGGIKPPFSDLFLKYLPSQYEIRVVGVPGAGAISRTCVAPLETIRTHLMVGSSGSSTAEVFCNIMQTDGWKGLFRGNLVNVIRVAPSKAIELFAFDTLDILTYPRVRGPAELYRGLAPSLIGVIPYAATNYFAYDTLRKVYSKVSKEEKIGNIETLLIGSLAGALSSSATFPLEVARKHMQVGALSGRRVYKNMLHALSSILEQEGIHGLYKGLGPSCLKLVPAAGISFMCYEACKRILVDEDEEA